MKDSAIKWWNEFWLPTHGILDSKEEYTIGYDADKKAWQSSVYHPNPGHHAVARLLKACPSLQLITQNIDALHGSAMQAIGVSEKRLIEIHGRIGLYKCIKRGCVNAKKVSLTTAEVGMEAGQWASVENLARCPRHRKGGAPCLPQSLLFDELYDSHDFYENDKVELWLSKAETFIFVGTSCAVGITQSILFAAMEQKLPVFNLNLEGLWETMEKMVERGEFQADSLSLLKDGGLEVIDILGPSEVVLPTLMDRTEALRAVGIGDCNSSKDVKESEEEVFEDAKWVGCERCEAWRKLPEGFDPSILPDVWICGMAPLLGLCCEKEESTYTAHGGVRKAAPDIADEPSRKKYRTQVERIVGLYITSQT